MIDSDFQKQKLQIVIRALEVGIEIPYKHEWSLFFRKGQLYQSYYANPNERSIIHKSEITLDCFIKFALSLDLEQVKRLYGETKLVQLQNKLIKENEDGE